MVEMKEPIAESLLWKWLVALGYEVVKSGAPPADLLARAADHDFVIEVKGEQANDRALRSQFYTAVGQVVLARQHVNGRPTRYALALTASYEELARQFVRALAAQGVSVLILRGPGRVQALTGDGPENCTHASAATQTRGVGEFAGGSGHPDGHFRARAWVYTVRDGRMAEAVNESSGQQLYRPSFAELCRKLRLHVGADSAARVLWRYQTQTE